MDGAAVGLWEEHRCRLECEGDVMMKMRWMGDGEWRREEVCKRR